MATHRRDPRAPDALHDRLCLGLGRLYGVGEGAGVTGQKRAREAQPSVSIRPRHGATGPSRKPRRTKVVTRRARNQRSSSELSKGFNCSSQVTGRVYGQRSGRQAACRHERPSMAAGSLSRGESKGGGVRVTGLGRPGARTGDDWVVRPSRCRISQPR